MTKVNISTLKKSSADLGRLTAAIDKINNPTTERTPDERYWKPDVDKAGNGYAVIRFLPAPAVDGDDGLPWVRLFDHGFQGPSGQWYIENSLTTLGQKDPVSEYNSILWNSTTDENSPARKQARVQKRRLHYISNILVVEDPKHPENVGKVFLYTFGKKIFDKITQAMNPEFQDETPMNPFDAWTGANFKLKIRKVDGYRNYDKSEFDKPSEIGTDEEIEKIWKSEYSLTELVAPDKFKSYTELEARLYLVLGNDGVKPIQTTSDDDSVEEEVVVPKKAPAKKTPVKTVADESGDDTADENIDYFKSLADDD